MTARPTMQERVSGASPGTVANVNTALANVTFTPAADFSGAATITTHVQDAAVTGPADGLITVNVTSSIIRRLPLT